MKKTVLNFFKRLRKDYFNSPLNAVLTLVIVFVLGKALLSLLQWGVFNAVWTGEDSSVAVPGGATWAFVITKLRFFFYGFYPAEEIWRVNLSFILLLGMVVPFFIKKIPHKIFLFPVLIIIWPLIIALLIRGGIGGLSIVDTNQWGGFTLTLILSSLGLIISFPIGILLALGRRSELKGIKTISVMYIEFFRGIPLISILFMSSVVVPFFLPEGFAVDKIFRIVIGLTLFQSAYLAEVIRGGLQAIPKQQYEAADALGFGYILKNYLIIMPQALKTVISNIGGISISFIKDTTLVQIIGMFDLLGIVHPLASDSNWLGMDAEGLIFAGMVYWLICFVISKITVFIEKKAGKLPASAAQIIVEGE